MLKGCPMFSKLSLRAKMLGAFTFMALLMVLLAGVALQKLAALNASTLDIGTNWLPSVEVLGNLDANIALVRLAQFRQVAARESSAKAVADKLMTERVALFDKNRTSYVKLISSPEEQALWNEFDGKWKRYM